MPRALSSCATAALASALAIPVCAQGTLQRGNVDFAVNAIPDSINSTTADCLFTAARPQDTNVLQRYWWYYRIGGDTREFPFNDGDTNGDGQSNQGLSQNYSGHVGFLTWQDVDERGMLSASWRIKLYGTTVPNTQRSGVAVSQMTLTNIGGAPLTVDVFVYSKWNMCIDHHISTGTPSRHHIVPDPSQCAIQGIFGEWIAVNPDHYEIANTDITTPLINRFVDNQITNLNDTGLPFGVIPHSDRAFQWSNRSLLPGQSATFTMLLAHNTSPCDNEAGSVNYGSGNPGTNGLPQLATARPPVAGSMDPVPRVRVDNGLASTTGFLMIGFQRASFPITPNVTLLLIPLIAVPLPMDANGATGLSLPIVQDSALCGALVNFQYAFPDAGAADSIAHTDGLEWTLGGY